MNQVDTYGVPIFKTSLFTGTSRVVARKMNEEKEMVWCCQAPGDTKVVACTYYTIHTHAAKNVGQATRFGSRPN